MNHESHIDLESSPQRVADTMFLSNNLFMFPISHRILPRSEMLYFHPLRRIFVPSPSFKEHDDAIVLVMNRHHLCHLSDSC